MKDVGLWANNLYWIATRLPPQDVSWKAGTVRRELKTLDAEDMMLMHQRKCMANG